jgi:hypothetical protein
LGEAETLLLDPSLAVSATIEAGGRLGGVTEWLKKMEVAYKKELALVVVGEPSAEEARQALASAQASPDTTKPASSLEVVVVETLDELLRLLRDRAKEKEAVRCWEHQQCSQLDLLKTKAPIEDHYQMLPLLRTVKREELPRSERIRQSQDGEIKEDDEFVAWRSAAVPRWVEELPVNRIADEQQRHELADIFPNLQQVVKDAKTKVPRLVVLGEPGSGKSSLVQYLAWECYENRHEPSGAHTGKRLRLVSEQGARLVPARVSLREWEAWATKSADPEDSLPEYLADRYKGVDHPPTDKQWENWLKRGEVLLLLDGLDEIDGKRPFIAALTRALTTFAQCPTILTCRTVSYEQHETLCPDFTVFTLAGLSDQQRDKYIDDYPAGERFDGKALIAQLNRAPQMRALAANPLLLSIICFVVDDPRGVSLPLRRSELYNKATEKLLTRTKRVSVTYPDGLADLPLIHKRRILERVAFTLFVNPDQQRKLTFDEESLLDALTSAAEQEGYGAKPAPYANALLEDLKHNTGLLRGDAERGYIFLHLTIQEYLAAGAIARMANKNGWDATVQASGINVTLRHLVGCQAWDPRYQEVIVLLAGQLKDPAKALDLLADKSKDDYSRYRLALAAQCLPEARKAFGHQPSDPVSPIDQITTAAFSCWWEHAINGTSEAVPHLTRAIPALGQVNGRVYRRAIADRSGEAIHSAPSGQAHEWPSLTNLILDLLRDENSDVRRVAARAVRGIGAAAATPEILTALATLLRDAESGVRGTAAGAMSQLMAQGVRIIEVASGKFIGWSVDELSDLGRER